MLKIMQMLKTPQMLKKKKAWVILLGVFTFLGMYWLYKPHRCIEGLDDIQPGANDEKPELSEEDAKALATSIQKQMEAAGVPKPSPDEVSKIFGELAALVKQEIAAAKKAEDDLTKADATRPVVNTTPYVFNPLTFFSGAKFGDAFCKINKGENSNPTALNNKCATLTAENCNATDCCIWANGAKCVAGDANGPTFINGVSSDADYYSYKYKCYGNCAKA
jgi:hypothetical protein